MRWKNIIGLSAFIATTGYTNTTQSGFNNKHQPNNSLEEECENPFEDPIITRAKKEGIEIKDFIQLPLKGNVTITSWYGRRNDPVKAKKGIKIKKTHRGIDIYSNQREIYPLTTGTLCYITNNKGYGNYMLNIPEETSGLEYMYGHLKSATIKFLEKTFTPKEKGLEGIVDTARCREITQEDQDLIIGYMGSTGYSTAPHLHITFGSPTKEKWTGMGIPFFDEYDPTPIIKALYKNRERIQQKI